MQEQNLNIYNRSERLDMRKTYVFKEANTIWNHSEYNSGKAIGFTMRLISDCSPAEPIEWEQYYMESGRTRLLERQAVERDEKLSPDEKEKAITVIDRENGRSINELIELSKGFHELLRENGLNVTREWSFNCLYSSIIDSAWIGYQREKQVMKVIDDLCSKYHGAECRKASCFHDELHGVDLELFVNGKRFCGIQVKGIAYKKAVENKENKESREYDKGLRERIEKYKDRYGIPVFFVFVNKDQVEGLEDIEKKLSREFMTKKEKKEEYKKNGHKAKKEENKPDRRKELRKKSQRYNDDYDDIRNYLG